MEKIKKIRCWAKNSPNMLLCGDNLPFLQMLLEQGKKVDLVYLDPPFATGKDFSTQIKLKNKKLLLKSVVYQDFRQGDFFDYLAMLKKRFTIIKALMQTTASIFVHLDYRAVHYIKVMLDEIFGRENFRNQIIWSYRDPSGRTSRSFLRKHDTILFYSKSKDYYFDVDSVRIPYAENTQKQAVRGDISFGRKTKLHPLGRPLTDVWDIPIINSQAKERLGYPTQKPLALLERIIKACSKENDVVLDPFCGSGTTLEVSEKLKRFWIGIEKNSYGIHLCRKRIIKSAKTPSFVEYQEIDSQAKNGEYKIFGFHKTTDALLSSEKQLQLFPIYDSLKLPIVKYHYESIKTATIFTFKLKDFSFAADQPQLKSLTLTELIDFVVVDNQGVRSIFTQNYDNIMIKLNDSAIILVEIYDIFGRVSSYVF